ncbi:MAG: chorismate mutase [Candidatus Bathyarchaeia archaeon]|nr:chorismate mutase [Candidatus Bathyarchaeota archaeon]
MSFWGEKLFPDDLKTLRDKVTEITLEIIRLSGERLSLARRIGEIKVKNKMPIDDPLVENELRDKVIDFSRKHGINIDFSLRLLNLLMEEAKRVQREVAESSPI